MTRAHRSARAVSAFATCALFASCGGTNAERARAANAPRSEPMEAVPSTHCGSGQARAVDANGDGRPEIKHYLEGSREVCTEYDLNYDGHIDVVRLFAADGKVAREEHDYDFDGHVDEVTEFEAGRVATKELDTNFDHFIDTRYWCDGALFLRGERSRNGQARPDMWELYEAGRLREVGYDDDADGAPERWEVFRAGQLSKIRYDNDHDGRPDGEEDVRSEGMPRDEAITCDGSPANLLPADPDAAPAAAPAAPTIAPAAVDPNAPTTAAPASATPTESATPVEAAASEGAVQ